MGKKPPSQAIRFGPSMDTALVMGSMDALMYEGAYPVYPSCRFAEYQCMNGVSPVEAESNGGDVIITRYQIGTFAKSQFY